MAKKKKAANQAGSRKKRVPEVIEKMNTLAQNMSRVIDVHQQVSEERDQYGNLIDQMLDSADNLIGQAQAVVDAVATNDGGKGE